MKALSIRQPWAWAILHAGKRLENRDWKGCAYRGPILIHAGKSVGTQAEFHDAAEDIEDMLAIGESRLSAEPGAYQAFCALVERRDCKPTLPRPELHRGGIVGRARIVDSIRDEHDFMVWRDAIPGLSHQRDKQRIWWAGGFALVLADVEPLPFVAWKGELGLFDVPDDYAARGQVRP